MRELVVIVGIPKAVRAFIENPLKSHSFNQNTEWFIISGLESYPRYTGPHLDNICKITKDKIDSYAAPPEKLRFIYLPCSQSENRLVESLFLIGDIRRVISESTAHTLNSQTDAPKLVVSISESIRAGMKTSKIPKRDFRILPPNNFITIERECLLDKFKACFIDKSIDINTLESSLQREKDQYSKNIYKDHRGCIYSPCKPNEEHGDVNRTNPLHQLKGMYRFGWFFGNGFHHDVQHHTKPTLQKCKFQCSIKGSIKCNSSAKYINIHLNDFVRGNIRQV